MGGNMNWTRLIFAQVIWVSMYFLMVSFVQWDWLWYEAVGEWRSADRGALLIPYVGVAAIFCLFGIEDDK